jgi:carbamoyltransferase
MKILGISAFYHDSAAAVVVDGRIVAAAQEERFTRKKHDAGFPREAVRFCLEHAGLRVDELDAVAFYDKPFIKFERLLETYYAFAPKGVASFITSMPVWMKEKLNLKKMLKDELKQLPGYDKRKLNLLFPEHHLSHAASAYYPSPFDSAAILTIDGVGEWATASICHGKGKDIKILRELRFPHSLGLLYSAFTYFLGFRVNSGEYKLMGLAPYGDPISSEVDKFEKLIRENLIEIKDDGSLWLNQKWFRYATGLRMSHDARWEQLFGFPRRKPEDELQMHHCNLGLAIQRITEEVVLKLAIEAKRLTGESNLCMAGGVALNCVANGKLQSEGIFDQLFIQPAAGDAGGAPGAALASAHIYFGEERPALLGLDRMEGSYLGPYCSNKEIEYTTRKYKAVADTFEDRSALYEKVAALLEQGKVVGWVQGRMEFGPRALGGRSILGDARNPEMQKKLNLKIKYRESFRPFAPSVLAEDVQEYFDYEGVSPYMLLVHPVAEGRRKQLPAGYASLPLRDKLYHLRSDLPAITHIDFSARIQTVHSETNPAYHALISAFKRRTGFGVIVNTSFNVRGEPIVCTADDAYRCFMRTEMDYLVIENHLFDKTQQPAWQDTDGWKEEFVLD